MRTAAYQVDEKDILERTEKIMAKFLDYLRENELLK